MFQPGRILGSRGVTASRIKRFARLRSTALPIERPADTPTREVSPRLVSAISTISGWAKDFPDCRTRLNSVDLVRRYLRFTHAYCPAHQCHSYFQHTAPVCSRHAGTESVHPHPASDFWLICSLRHTYFLSKYLNKCLTYKRRAIIHEGE
jgi:hypothetical protein